MTRAQLVVLSAALFACAACAACGGATALGTSGDGGGGAADGGDTAGKIACGAVVCDALQNQYCCMESLTVGSCRDKASKSLCQGFAMECDDSTDCPAASRICCLRPNGMVSNAGAGCQSSCIMNAESYQLCRVAAECEYDAGGCVPETCGGRALQTCGTIYPPSCK